jgi:DNA-binding transcriptional ArsR family regulator
VSATRKTPESKRRRATGPPDARVIKAIGHPLRRAILVALNETQASPTQLARRFGEPVNLVAYHTGILAKAGAVELVHTEPRRGSTEHFYRATMRPFFEDREWAKLPLETRRAVFDQDIKRIVADVRQAVLDELLEIQGRVAGRQVKKGTDHRAPVATEVAILQFERRDRRSRRRLAER